MVFKQVGKFFSKTIPKVVSKDIPRIVTKDIPKVVTKDIPKVVTKDIPRIVTKDIPNAFSSVGERETYDPQLVGLRKDVASAETTLGERRDTFFTLKAEYAGQRKRYQQLTEDYARRSSDSAAALRTQYIPDREWNDPVAGDKEALRHVENSFRFIVGFLTLGLGEGAWAKPEAKQEREFLTKRLSTLKAVNLKLGQAIADLAQANQEMKTACDDIVQSLGAENAQQANVKLNEKSLAEGIDEGRRDIAVSMLRAAATVEQVMMITELDEAVVRQLAADVPTNGGAAPGAVSEQEHLDQVQAMIEEGMAPDEIASVTGLSVEKINSLTPAQ